MTLKRKPFESTHLVGEKKKRDIFSVEPAPRQRELLNQMKEVLDMPSDSVVTKYCFEFGANAMLEMFGAKNLAYLTRVDRARKRHKNIKESEMQYKPDKNATHSHGTP